MKFIVASIAFIFAGFNSLAYGADAVGVTIESVELYNLETPLVFYWEKEKPEVKNFSLVVLRASENLVRRKQGLEEVIFFEDRVAERVRILDKNRFVVIVPLAVTLNTHVWVGPKALPETLDSVTRRQAYEKIRTELGAPTIFARFQSFIEPLMGRGQNEVTSLEDGSALYEKAGALK